LSILLLLVLIGPATAADLHHVTVDGPDDATLLKSVGVDPIARVDEGYLVLTKPATSSRLQASGLKSELLATGVERDNLAFDNRMDQTNADRFPTVYQEGDLRLYRIDPAAVDATAEGLNPLRDRRVPIIWTEPARDLRHLKSGLRSIDVPLDSLIGLVSQDTLNAYILQLQSWYRVQGSSDNFAARDWIHDRFVDYGYDSVYLDPFGSGYNNVVAVKPGTRFPDYHLIVGGHFDAVSGSPGADDNGSGTAAVMECARVLANIDCDMTMIFIAFDAEESGLNGSEHYADEALANGDNVHFMFNMDMIAHYENSSDVKTYHGDEMSYPNLFNDLCDSLVGLTGHLSGNIAASDHWPFHQNGWPIVMAHEYEFSTVYHTYQDSATYMDFVYMTKVVKGALATCYSVSQTTGPRPALAFSYPEGLPEFVLPFQPDTVEVVIDGLYDGVPVAGSGKLHYNVDYHGWTTQAMTETSPNHYQAVLPSSDCFSKIQYYFTADEETEGEYSDPDGDPYTAVVATEQVELINDDFDTDLGWTTQGLWERGQPTGGGGSYGYPDPTEGHSGPNVMGYNLNGDYENGLSETYLTAPALDCSDLVGVKFSFWRWLGVEQPSYDHAYIRVSTNGTTWTTLWENTAEVAENSWSEHVFDISQYADGEPTVYIRFVMGATDYAWTYCGWNIDEFRVVGYTCDDGAPLITTDTLPDWTVDVQYSHQLEATGGHGDLTWSDKNGDLDGTGLSLATDGMLTGTPTTEGAVGFTAMVTDTAGTSDEQPFSFTVNPIVVITTDTLPTATEGEPYSYTLLATGGTGGLTFSDKYDDLNGTGLDLLSDGTVEGSPIAPGSFAFVAEAIDDVGYIEDKALTLNVVASYICGDADGNGTGPDISDLVYLTGYMFGDGPPPPDMRAVDVNGDGTGPDISDLVYLTTYMFGSGPAPDCP
jgi:hypothetical protein